MEGYEGETLLAVAQRNGLLQQSKKAGQRENSSWNTPQLIGPHSIKKLTTTFFSRMQRNLLLLSLPYYGFQRIWSEASLPEWSRILISFQNYRKIIKVCLLVASLGLLLLFFFKTSSFHHHPPPAPASLARSFLTRVLTESPPLCRPEDARWSSINSFLLLEPIKNTAETREWREGENELGMLSWESGKRNKTIESFQYIN